MAVAAVALRPPRLRPSQRPRRALRAPRPGSISAAGAAWRVQAPPTIEAFAGLGFDDQRRIWMAEKARRSLAEFVRQAWHVEHGKRPLHWGWHLDAICEHLEAVTSGEIKRLIINVPPGMSKSLLVSVYWPAWEWLQDPSLQYLATSAGEKVVLRDAVRCQEVVESKWYQKSFMPSWTWDKRQAAKSYYKNTQKGFRISLTTGSKQTTGNRADRIIIDDPLDAIDAYTGSAALAEHVRYFDEVLSDRLNSNEDGRIVVIMQRLHELDLSGHLLAKGGWEHLCLPAEYDPNRHCRTSIGWEDPRTAGGELLDPKRLGLEVLKQKRIDKGPRVYAGQYDQAPAPAAGAIFLRKWFRYWQPETLPEFDFIIGSWDTTWKSSKDSDFCVGQVWGVHGQDKYLLWQVRSKMNLPDGKRAFQAMLERFEPNAILVEYSTTGPALVEAFQAIVPGIEPIEQRGESKESRANAVTGQMEDGQVYFPDPLRHPWVSEVLEPELLAFPAGANDDQVDALTQALIWISRNGNQEPWIFTM